MGVDQGSSTAGFSKASRQIAQATPRERLILPTLTVIAHPDFDRIGDRVSLGELISGRETRLSRQEPRFTAPGGTSVAPLADPFLSRSPILLKASANGDIEIRRGASRTHLAIDGESVDQDHVVALAKLEDGVVLELAKRVALLLHLHSGDRGETPEKFGLVGNSTAMLQIRETIARVADLGVPVLIRGETGTGKELVARALHDSSPRRQGPFVSVNFGALSPALAAAELFGAKKGAFTGAVRDQPGYFLRADGGTLLLDEIGEAPAELQVLLLRALETHEILPVGSQSPRPIDVRVLSSTDADLEHLIAGGGFRAPLLHRLAGYTIHLPPLRRRQADIGLLFAHFLRREREQAGEPPPPNTTKDRVPWLPTHLMTRLVGHDWPGNVRQLRNFARQVVIDSRDLPTLDPDRGLNEISSAATSRQKQTVAARPVSPPSTGKARRWRKPSSVTEDELLAALRAQHFNLKATALALGISRTSLYSLLERSPNVRAAADVPEDEIRGAWEQHGADLDLMVADLEISERALRQRLKDLGLASKRHG